MNRNVYLGRRTLGNGFQEERLSDFQAGPSKGAHVTAEIGGDHAGVESVGCFVCIRDPFGELLDNKHERWLALRTEASERLKELGEYFSGEKVNNIIIRNILVPHFLTLT